jgi:uncharacterized protein YkwD
VHFVPTQVTEKAMRTLKLLLVVVLLLAVGACDGGSQDLQSGGGGNGSGGSGGGNVNLPSGPTASEAQLAQEVLDLLNQHRAANGETPLAMHAGLAQVAFLHSADMHIRGFFDHINPDGDDPFDRMQNAGISYSYAGENIAMGQPSPQSVMNA